MQIQKQQVNYFSLVMLYVASLFISSIAFVIIDPIVSNRSISTTGAQVVAQIICITLFIKMDFLSIKSSIINFAKEKHQAALKCIAMYLLAIIATIILVPTLNNIIEAIAQLFDSTAAIPDNSENQSVIESLLKSGDAVVLILMILLVTILAPIFEELIFRKALIGLMDNYFKAKWLGYGLSVVLFAGIHVAFAQDYLSIGPYLVSGASFTAIYWYNKENIVYPIVVHMIWNIVVTIMVLNG